VETIQQPEAMDRGVEAAMARASRNLARLGLDDDPLFPTAVLRARRRTRMPLDECALLEAWRTTTPREAGAARYRWPISPRFTRSLPSWVGREDTWIPWRPREAIALQADRDHLATFTSRLITPLVLADVLDLLDAAVDRGDDWSRLARELLAEALPKVHRDASEWVQENHAWSDTWALWAFARRPRALGRLHPFALAIGDAYAASARRTGDRVLGSRFPFHDVPLVSASAQLATGLVALGFHPKLIGRLATWVRHERRPDGGWGDGDGPPDVLTTLVAADLLATLDPGFDPARTAWWLAAAQRPDGWWRAFGPESTWLTVEILDWLETSGRPFAERFRWPHIALANRDRRTSLPFYGYYSDLERLFAELPSLARSEVEVAFIDLAGFGTFNNAFGMAAGDAALRAFALALARIRGGQAIRDGGDEFIVVGAPTARGLPQRIARFRETWPAEFASAFPGGGVVAPRILTATTTGARIVDARNLLGVEIGGLKRRYETVGPGGIQVDLGRLAG
jgi:GGDEF domain-containing protein